MENPDEQAAEAQAEPSPDRSGDLVETASGELIKTHEIGHRTYIVAQVDPLDVDGVRTVQVGTAMWLVAFVLLLPFYSRLREDDKLWWLWTCLAGFGLGLVGWDYCRRRRNRRHARATSAAKH